MRPVVFHDSRESNQLLLRDHCFGVGIIRRVKRVLFEDKTAVVLGDEAVR